VHIAGERLFVDFAGRTVEVMDAATGEIKRVEIFVAVLGASSFIYAEATASQALPTFSSVPATAAPSPVAPAAATRARACPGWDSPHWFGAR
jgi:transposase